MIAVPTPAATPATPLVVLNQDRDARARALGAMRRVDIALCTWCESEKSDDLAAALDAARRLLSAVDALAVRYGID